METQSNVIEILFERAETYRKTTFELSKLKLLETTTVVATALISRLSVITMIGAFAIFFTIGIALWLGESLGKPYYGFFIVGAFYLAAGIVLHYFLPEWIRKPISDLVIKQGLQ